MTLYIDLSDELKFEYDGRFGIADTIFGKYIIGSEPYYVELIVCNQCRTRTVVACDLRRLDDAERLANDDYKKRINQWFKAVTIPKKETRYKKSKGVLAQKRAEMYNSVIDEIDNIIRKGNDL